MFQVDYQYDKGGWQQPLITPYGPLKIETSASCLHYGISHFEGVSIYKNQVNQIPQAIRVQDTLDSFKNSADRIDMPLFDTEELLKCLKMYVNHERHNFPQIEDPKLVSQLYLRLVHISTYGILGIKQSKQTKLYGIINPNVVENKSLKVITSSGVSKSWPLGHGSFRLSGNIGCLSPAVQEAKSLGYDDVLWMMDDYIQELTDKNVYIYWQSRFGKKELVVPLDNGCIFNGLIRRSILDIKDEIKQSLDIDLVVRNISIHEIINASKERRLYELFASSQATQIQSIEKLRFAERVVDLDQNFAVANFVRQKFIDIATSDIKPDWITKFEP
ncbi:branched-chain amino acid aminotransferase [Stylonychia lemnae]|uniref:Branched-chain amino acid aminotransferase n=1 Tax=Stylonychia lemnae TaxID=5949 RepID=A0A078A5Q1_STYLE|nr:branched-chain amino acid aminotransferase [Stylonychia lemnae]|eukprot:CDW77575.1 branched-chain amino acid aminotransferase [Stylonychia lemnae]